MGGRVESAGHLLFFEALLRPLVPAVLALVFELKFLHVYGHWFGFYGRIFSLSRGPPESPIPESRKLSFEFLAVAFRPFQLLVY